MRAERDVLQRQRSCPAGCRRCRRPRSCRRPSGRPAAGCSASRRRRRSAARCAPSGSGRTRSSTTFAGMSVLVALEVDDAVDPLVAAAAPPRRQLAVVVAAARSACSGSVSGLCGSVVVISSNVWTVWNRAAGRRRLVFANRHDVLRPLQELGHLLALAQLDVGLLPVRALADEPALALELAVRDRGAHRCDLRAEQLLDRALDVDLVGVAAPPRTRSSGRLRAACVVFSVTSGRRMTSVSFMMRAPPAASRAPRASRSRVGVHDVARGHAAARHAAARRRCCAPTARSFSSSFTSTSSACRSTPSASAAPPRPWS